MSDIITSIITGGTNSHVTTSEEANAVATDFITQGVVGTITSTSGVSPATGSFAINQSTSPAMTVDITIGTAYITCTPSGQATQSIRAKMSSNTTAYVIAANTSGSTKYDWIYLKADATKANDSDAIASDVTSIYTSRSTSASTDNGTPPTYGILLAVVTVANNATSIINANIADKRKISIVQSSAITTATGSATPTNAGNYTLSTVDLSRFPTGSKILLIGTIQWNKVTGTPGSTFEFIYNSAVYGAVTTTFSYTASIYDGRNVIGLITKVDGQDSATLVLSIDGVVGSASATGSATAIRIG